MQIKLPRFPGNLIARRLAVSGRTLLYFSSEGCAPCDDIIVFVGFIGRLASASGLALRVVNARRGALAEHGHGDSLLLDKTGELRRTYRVNVFPTLILTDERGRVERVIVGGEADGGRIRAGLGLSGLELAERRSILFPATLPPVKFTVLSTSLDPDSRSRWMANLTAAQLRAAGHAVTLLDLRETPLPIFDNDTCYAHPHAARYHAGIREADGVFLAVPVYNWGVGAGAKNLVELTGSTDPERGLHGAWFDQPVTFLVSGGLAHGYLSHGAFAFSLMTDFRCVVNPHFVYATGAECMADGVPGEWLATRLAQTVERGADLSARLRGRAYSSVWEV